MINNFIENYVFYKTKSKNNILIITKLDNISYILYLFDTGAKVSIVTKSTVDTL